MLSDRCEYVEGEAGGVGKVDRDEIDLAFHQLSDHRDVARQPIEAGDQQHSAKDSADLKRFRNFRPPVVAPALGLGIFGDEFAGIGGDVICDRRLLRRQAEAGRACSPVDMR